MRKTLKGASVKASPKCIDPIKVVIPVVQFNLDFKYGAITPKAIPTPSQKKKIRKLARHITHAYPLSFMATDGF